MVEWGMNTVVLSGWQSGDPGLNKVELTKLIRSSNGLGLADAKALVDRLVDGVDIELTFTDREAAESFSEAAIALGAQIRTGSVR
jgi:ribosomal protein L7/L12